MNKLFYAIFTVILASGLIFGCTGTGVPTPTVSTTYDAGYNSDDYDSCESDDDYDLDDYDSYESDDDYDLDDYDSYESDDEYDYDKGYGYTEPEEGESFSDYVKRQDPELYESLQDRYDAATDDY